MTLDNSEASAIDPRMIAAAEESGCAESRLFMRRRDVLGLSIGLFTAAVLPTRSYAEDPELGQKRLLIVLLRGGLDGLNVVPQDQNGYFAKRGTLKLNLSLQTALTGYDGYYLNSNMPNFAAMFNNTSPPPAAAQGTTARSTQASSAAPVRASGSAGATPAPVSTAPDLGRAKLVLAIAPPLRTRSHFDCSFNLENGTANSARTENGWLNALFGYMANSLKAKFGPAPLQVGNTPVILTGKQLVYSWSPVVYNPDFFANSAAKQNLIDLYARSAGTTGLRGNSLNLSNLLSKGLLIDGFATQNKSDNALSRAFSGAAQILSQAVGPRIAVVTVDNFDTHIGTTTNSSKVLKVFDSALDDFRAVAQKKGWWNNALIVGVSEFGRSVTDNADGGSDHGTGGVALLAGGAIKKSGIIGNWPDFEKTPLLDNNDIPAPFDTRDLFRRALIDHMGVPRVILDKVFPDFDTSMTQAKAAKIPNILS